VCPCIVNNSLNAVTSTQVKWSSTLCTGSHKHHEPDYKLHKIGWACITLPPKLESAYRRSLGNSNCGWVPARSHIHPLSIPATTRDKDIRRERSISDTRSHRTANKRGNSGDQSISRLLCLPDIPGGKEGWRAETCNQPEGAQPICQGRTFQDGEPAHPSRASASRGLDGKNGSEGCIPSDTHSPNTSATPDLPVEGKYYKFTCLPFGLSVAPRVFTKILKPVVGFLRQVRCWLIIYLDDLLILHQDRDQLHHFIKLTCQHLGLTINHKKSLLTPIQNLVFLGFNINSQTMELSLPQEKLRKIKQDVRRLLIQSTLSIGKVAQFLGKATATLRALPTAPLHYRG